MATRKSPTTKFYDHDEIEEPSGLEDLVLSMRKVQVHSKDEILGPKTKRPEILAQLLELERQIIARAKKKCSK